MRYFFQGSGLAVEVITRKSFFLAKQSCRLSILLDWVFFSINIQMVLLYLNIWSVKFETLKVIGKLELKEVYFI